MLTSLLAIITALAGVQVLLVVKLADFITEGVDRRGTRAGGIDLGRAGIA